ncbi:MAG: peptidoglycan-binding protein [Candidatus Izemoplasmatales bacterium]|nr:peptidoglycan-binding protein [Candidatus Izemoplasmatales bacterium]
MANMKAFLDVLASWYGYNEANGTDDIIIKIYNDQRPAGTYKMNMRDAWCQATISAAAYKSGNKGYLPNTCACVVGVQWFKDRGRWVGRYQSNYNPIVGDIIYYDWDGNRLSEHVGAVVKVSGSNLTVREGNKNDRLEDRVISKNSSLILGYGRPNWDSATAPVNPVGTNTNPMAKGWLTTGDKGDQVKDLQTKLNKVGFDCGNVDGDFGAKTLAAVKAFQKTYALTVDGMAGELTLAKLNSVYASLGYKPWVGEISVDCTVYSKADSTSTALPGYPKLNKTNLVDVVGEVSDGKGNTYFKIMIAKLHTGYVLQSKMKMTGTNSVATKYKEWVGEVTASALNVRENAGVEYNLIKEYPQLAKTNLVSVIGEKKASDNVVWYYVAIAGKFKGYCSSKHIKRR